MLVHPQIIKNLFHLIIETIHNPHNNKTINNYQNI
jgi:hypothetical protein